MCTSDVGSSRQLKTLLPGLVVLAAGGREARGRPAAKMSEEHYLELCDGPVHFEHASSVNNVFFDEANKQVSGYAS